MASEQRKMIVKMMEPSDLSDFQKETILANFDYAVARERIELCKMRNKISGILSGLQSAQETEAEIIERMHTS